MDMYLIHGVAIVVSRLWVAREFLGSCESSVECYFFLIHRSRLSLSRAVISDVRNDGGQSSTMLKWTLVDSFIIFHSFAGFLSLVLVFS